MGKKAKIRDGLLSGYLRKARLTRAAKYVKGKHILDIGCDRGYMIPYLPDDISYHGIDVSSEVLEAASRHYPQHRFQELKLSIDSVKDISQSQYDSIVMIAIVEHLDHPIEVLKVIREKLNPKGRVIITTPHQRSHRLLVAMAYIGLARNDKHEHENYIDHKMIKTLIDAGQFNLIEYERFQFGLNQLWVLEKSDD